MGKVDDLKAELALAHLEEELVALKAKPDTPANAKKLREHKDKVRQARLEHRTAREAAREENA